MDNITVRYATKEDVDAFHRMHESIPDHGHTHTLENTIRAWVVEKDGELACIAGVIFGKGYVEAFSDMMPGLKASKRTIYKYAKILANNIKGLNIPVIALAKENPDSSKFLMSMGFKFVPTPYIKKVFRI